MWYHVTQLRLVVWRGDGLKFSKQHLGVTVETFHLILFQDGLVLDSCGLAILLDDILILLLLALEALALDVEVFGLLDGLRILRLLIWLVTRSFDVQDL